MANNHGVAYLAQENNEKCIEIPALIIKYNIYRNGTHHVRQLLLLLVLSLPYYLYRLYTITILQEADGMFIRDTFYHGSFAYEMSRSVILSSATCATTIAAAAAAASYRLRQDETAQKLYILDTYI